jgi:hypothetical protein
MSNVEETVDIPFDILSKRRSDLLANTLSLPHAGGTIVLERRDDSAPYTSVYSHMDTDREVRLTVRHTKTKTGRDRHNVELVRTTFATGTTPERVYKYYQVSEQQPGDLDIYDMLAVHGLLAANTNEIANALVQGIS